MLTARNVARSFGEPCETVLASAKGERGSHGVTYVNYVQLWKIADVSPFFLEETTVSNEYDRFQLVFVEVRRSQRHDETAQANDGRRVFREDAANDVM